MLHFCFHLTTCSLCCHHLVIDIVSVGLHQSMILHLAQLLNEVGIGLDHFSPRNKLCTIFIFSLISIFCIIMLVLIAKESNNSSSSNDIDSVNASSSNNGNMNTTTNANSSATTTITRTSIGRKTGTNTSTSNNMGIKMLLLGGIHDSMLSGSVVSDAMQSVGN